MSSQPLRPLERRILRQVAAGDDVGEIGRRLRRSPEFVQRVIEFIDIDRGTPETTSHQVLRPLERRVLRLRADGVNYDDLGSRFRRSPAHVERVERLANVKQARAQKP
jgi:DNA-binding CsgD family transcriptional regulator